jgi:pyruvate kinase
MSREFTITDQTDAPAVRVEVADGANPVETAAFLRSVAEELQAGVLGVVSDSETRAYLDWSTIGQ